MKKLDKSLKKIKEGINRIEEMDWSANETLLIEKLTYDILEKNISLTTALGYEVSVNPYVQRAQEVLNDQQAYGEWLGKDHMSKKIKDESFYNHALNFAVSYDQGIKNTEMLISLK